MAKILIAGNIRQCGNYLDALIQLGADPLICLDPEKAAGCDALLLPGGGDIDPALFGEADQGCRNVNGVLDRQQLAILSLFVRAGKPVLGICKGMQIINVFFGGTIIQDLPTARDHQYNGQDQAHRVHTSPGSLLYTLYGADFVVNSAHHQGIGLPGKELCVVQRAPDHVVEAVAHSSLPILGVQWHPERMCFSRARDDTINGAPLLSAFLHAAKTG